MVSEEAVMFGCQLGATITSAGACFAGAIDRSQE